MRLNAGRNAIFRRPRSKQPVAFCFACLCLLAFATTALAQEVALTFDDLPAHGPLPPGVTRTDVVNSIIKTLQDARVPQVYGFVNAHKLEQSPEDIEVLKAWRNVGFLLGNHTFSHLSLNDNSVEKFEQDTAANEPVLKSLMAGQDWQWFRYPFLWEGDTLEKRHDIRSYLKDHGYRIAQVTLDFEDYL
jgi:peptidoglycan-N-acetylglucosamine deacetylase